MRLRDHTDPRVVLVRLSFKRGELLRSSAYVDASLSISISSRSLSQAQNPVWREDLLVSLPSHSVRALLQKGEASLSFLQRDVCSLEQSSSQDDYSGVLL